MVQVEAVPPVAAAGPGRGQVLVGLLGSAGLLLILAVLVPGAWATLGLLMVAATIAVYVAISALLAYRARGDRFRLLGAVSGFVSNDSRASFITDERGTILFRNAVAADRFQPRPSETLAIAFNDLCANPGAVLFRMQDRARATGVAREDVVTRRGHLRLFVQRIEEGSFLWRIEDIAERSAVARGTESLGLPMLTAGPTGTVLFMNEAFRRIVGGRPKTLKRVFRDLPLVSGRVHQVETKEGPVDSLVAEVKGAGGRREIYLLPAEAAGQVRTRASGWDAIEDLPVPLLKVAATGEVLSSNREARALFQVPIGGNVRMSDLLEGWAGRSSTGWPRRPRGAAARRRSSCAARASIRTPSCGSRSARRGATTTRIWWPC